MLINDETMAGGWTVLIITGFITVMGAVAVSRDEQNGAEAVPKSRLAKWSRRQG